MSYGNPSAAPSYSALAGSQNQPARLSEVQQQVERSQAAIERMQEKMKSLFARLQPVLRSTTPSQEGKDAMARPALVGHANALSNHNDQLEQIDMGLAEILDRLEL